MKRLLKSNLQRYPHEQVTAIRSAIVKEDSVSVYLNDDDWKNMKPRNLGNPDPVKDNPCCE